jgi:nucleoside-diphosphate-sugar epimerase
MKVLYIGGTGEISYCCVHASVELGHEVTVLNRGRNDEPLPPAVRIVQGDLSDPRPYASLGDETFDVVCQFLAYDLNAIERDIAEFGGRCGQYVFISSASVYQKPPTSYLITERTPVGNPYWPYSQAKVDMERRLMQAHEAWQLPVTIVRPSHTYRRKFPTTFSAGGSACARPSVRRPIVVHGDGTAVWTITRSEDFARPFVKLLGNRQALGEVFHITRDREGYLWRQIYQAIAASLGVEADFVYVPTDTLLRYRPEWTGSLLGDKAWPTLFDNSKVKSVVGDYECRIGLTDGIQRAAEHVKKRIETFTPDSQMNELLDRIAAEQSRLGT